MRAFHCVDICFWFYNTDVMLSHTGGGAAAEEAVDARWRRSLLQFMKTGDPERRGPHAVAEVHARPTAR